MDVAAPVRPVHAAEADEFWRVARAALDGLPGGGLNIAYEAVDRHVAHGHGDRTALIHLAADGSRHVVSYRALREQTNRFASVLDELGVTAGETVFLLLPRGPAVHVAALGAMKHGAVVCPLFSAFGPEPIAARMGLGRARVLVTTAALHARKIAPIRDRLTNLTAVLIVDDEGPAPDGTVLLAPRMAAGDPERPIAATRPDDLALLHFTSGTTGTPKGALHAHEAVVAHDSTGRAVLGLRPTDVFWCTADPGWVTGMSYGVIAPLTNGVTAVIDEREFDVDQWYRLLESEHVTVWYTAPTALRMLMRAGTDRARAFDLSALRFVASVGEPLNPEVVVWSDEAFGQPVHDTWWQTETGGIMIANEPGAPVRPGSMGRPLPGVEAVLLARGPDGRASVAADGSVAITSGPDEVGELALRAGWPSMFRGYLDAPERYAACFAGPWYLTGDLARRDENGDFWFVGRADDVIKTAGHLVGPFEVESTLMEHPAVVEAAVYGVPDPVSGEVVHARVSLRPGFEPTDALRRELIALGRTRLGAAVAPRAIAFDQHLPKTSSGKIMRRVLRARELGEPEGDLSTLEPVPGARP